jgi:hypothetical protein
MFSNPQYCPAQATLNCNILLLFLGNQLMHVIQINNKILDHFGAVVVQGYAQVHFY